ncbi:MAG: helix-turn-helix transcriptional regulator [Alphaproteobacteria bacterium]|nr:MAG: helix-turn-helix transcriptional regulator [Alphaproteobacteria bacterium]
MFSKDSVSKDSIPYHHFGVDPKQVQIYSQTHSRLDPFSNLRLFDVGQVVSIPELVPYDEFRRGRFFLEWMEPQGWVDAANCVLEKSVLRCSFLTIIRSKEQGPVDDEMRERMALVVPHVRRAVPIGREMDVEQIRTAALTNVLDGLSAGMFLIAGDGTVMHANSAGQGMLVAEDCDMNAQVQQALTAAVQAGLGVDNLTLPVTAGNGDRYLIHVLPLSSGARRDAPVAHPTCAAVFVQKAVLDGLAPQVMARAFDLTPTELRVLLAIIEVGGIPQAASMLGVADSTVKTHVGRLFEKTGTCRQADLVKLAAGYCTPLLN